VGTVLWSSTIGPLPQCLTGTGPGTKVKDSFYPTLTDYVSAPFQYWRGSMRYHFDIVATAFHTGRLYLAVNYGDFTTPTSMLNFTDQYGVMMDVNAENHHYTFDVPFLSPYEFMRVPNGPNLNDDDGVQSYSMGMISLVVANQLVQPNNVSTTVQVNIYVSGGDDFELNSLNLSHSSLIPYTAQGAVDTAEMDTMAQRMKAVVIGTQRIVPVDDHHFGERYDTVRDILKRYVPAVSFVGVGGFFGGVPYLTNPLIQGVVTAENLMRNGMMGYLGSMFCVWRGSLRAKVFWDVNPILPIATATFSPTNTTSRWGVVWEPGNALSEDMFINLADKLTQSMTWLWPYQFTNITTASFPQDSSTPYRQPYTATGYLSNPYDIQTTITPPVDMADNNAAYHEVELPFTTQYNILINPVIGASGGEPADSYLSNPGAMVLMDFSPRSLYGLGQDRGTSARPQISVWGAAGDDFRFGLLLGPHRLLVNGVNIAGDTVWQSFPTDKFNTSAYP
jgi:hypothetical protein